MLKRMKDRSELNKKMGIVPRVELIEYDCQKCEDREIVLIKQEDGSFSARDCECKAQKIQKRMFRASGLSEEQARLMISDYKPSQDTMKMYQMAKRYIDLRQWEEGKGFALFGSVGIGKTMLAQIIASEIMRSKKSVIFVPTTSLMAELRSSQFSEDRSNFEQRIEKLINVDVVIFDDVGKEKPTGWVQDQYFRIVDGRYNNKKATGFTSNYEFDELEKRFSEFGEAIVSRFISMTRDYAVNIQADDWRRR
jgi:DNA replication protein DnaC